MINISVLLPSNQYPGSRICFLWVGEEYTAIPEALCAVLDGATGQEYFAETSVEVCKIMCNQNDRCEAFTYDIVGSNCRTFTSCPKASHNTNYGQEYTIYLRSIIICFLFFVLFSGHSFQDTSFSTGVFYLKKFGK